MKPCLRCGILIELLFVATSVVFGQQPPAADSSGYDVWVEDSLNKVPEDQPPPTPANGEVVLDVARGEYEAAQIAIRPRDEAIPQMRAECGELYKEGGAARLPAPRLRFVDSVPLRSRAVSTYVDPETVVDHNTGNEPAWIPDPLYEVPYIDVWQSKTRAIWLTFRIPTDAEPGLYAGLVRIFANKAVLTVPLKVRVYEATVPAGGTLKVTNWLRIDRMAEWGGCELFDDRFWELVRIYAENMAAHRHNVIFTPVSEFYTPVKLVTIQADEGRLRFDFSRFDRWVEIFKEAGAIGYIEGSHIGAKGNVHCWSPREGRIVHEVLPVNAPQAKEYLAQFFKALQEHLEQKDWIGIYYQHLMDEPQKSWRDEYNAAVHLVRKVAPRIKIIEATQTTDIEQPDIAVPIQNQLAENLDYYRKLQGSGREVWFYTTVLGRRLGDDLLTTRYLHWLNFKYNATGYLHWGYNWWETLTPFTQIQVTHSPRGPYPPGTQSAVYPGPKGVIDSIRWETVRDGIEDYELLMMLKARAPDKARSLCDTLVRGFRDCEMDVHRFRDVRSQLLMALEP
jgi:hypothetical protein